MGLLVVICFTFSRWEAGWRANADMCAAADCQLMAPQANGGPAPLLTTPCGGGLGLEHLLYQVAMVYSEIRRCVSTVFFVDPLHKSLQKLVCGRVSAQLYYLMVFFRNQVVRVPWQ